MDGPEIQKWTVLTAQLQGFSIFSRLGPPTLDLTLVNESQHAQNMKYMLHSDWSILIYITLQIYHPT